MKHEVGDIWKDDWDSKEPYSIQFPKHIEGAKSKKDAERKSKLAIMISDPDGQCREKARKYVI